jgi:hypothetical protein
MSLILMLPRQSAGFYRVQASFALGRLHPLEGDELPDFAARVIRELPEVVEDPLVVVRTLRRDNLGFARKLLEKAAQRKLEHLQDPEENVEANFVLSVLHPGKVGLRDADLRGEACLSEMAALPDQPDLLPDEQDLGGLR